MINYNDMTDNGAEGYVNGIYYEWGLASDQGAWFRLYPEPKHTRADLTIARQIIKHNRDAVSISVERNA